MSYFLRKRGIGYTVTILRGSFRLDWHCKNMAKAVRLLSAELC